MSDEITKYLRPEEQELSENCFKHIPTLKALEALATCRRLMGKHQWVPDYHARAVSCLECKKLISTEMLQLYKGKLSDLHHKGCAWAKAIDTGRK